MEMTALSTIKPVVWIGTTKADLTSFPEDVKDAIGYALYIAQGGGKHADAKPLRGFSGAGILEIVEDHAGDTYRAVYTVRLAGAYTSCMCSRRNQRPESRRRNLRLS
jgi:phage-related protein